MEAHPTVNNHPLILHAENAERVLTIFIRSELRRTGHSKAVIGLSGGVDSALSTYLAARALGSENVHALLMPYRASSPESIADAEAVVTTLGISSETFNITPIADPFFSETEAALGEVSRMRRGNIMARLRMITLYDRSLALGALVVGTSNKTESLLGYTTLFGDNASAINPLGDLYKTQVWQLAEHLGVPESIIRKPPTADLWPGQTDEADLGVTYLEADKLLYYMVDERETDAELMQRGYDPESILRMRKKIRITQFKRSQPIIAKLSGRTINSDFRYPRDWGT